MTGQSCVPNFNSILASQGHIKEVLISISSFEPVIPLANANSQLISIVDLNQLTGPPQCKLFEQKQLSLSLNSHRSVPNSNLPAYLHPGWASPKCKVTSLVLTKLLPPLNCTPPLHYGLRPIKGVHFRFANFASHFIRVQIFQIDFPLILYL